MINIKKSIAAAVFIFTALFIFADTNTADLTKRYLELSQTQLNNGQYGEALNSVTAALKLNENEGIPANVCVIASQVYSKMLSSMKETEDFSRLTEIEGYIDQFPCVADSSVHFKLKEIQELNRLKIEQAQFHSETKLINTVVTAVLAVCVVFVFVFFIVIIGIRRAEKSRQEQTRQFEETLKIVAGMQQTNTQILLGNVTDLQGIGINSLKSAGSSRWGQNALPEPELNDEEKEELKQLAVSCEDLGAKIDSITKRKNNSKNVSELVYKLALNLGCNQNTAMAYFCAAMVYDAGFLAVPEEMLAADVLTEQEKEVIHDHVNKTDDYFNFVPERYIKIFEDAARFHHENEDGSGYPNGLKSNHIPQVSKLIHVAESYSSLVSRRNYKSIMDKESAVEELRSKPEVYDPVVVKALDSIV